MRRVVETEYVPEFVGEGRYGAGRIAEAAVRDHDIHFMPEKVPPKKWEPRLATPAVGRPGSARMTSLTSFGTES